MKNDEIDNRINHMIHFGRMPNPLTVDKSLNEYPKKKTQFFFF